MATLTREMDALATLTRENMSMELHEFNTNLQRDVSEPTIALGEDLRSEFHSLGTTLQRDVAGVSQQVYSMLKQETQRVLQELVAIRQLLAPNGHVRGHALTPCAACGLSPPAPPVAAEAGSGLTEDHIESQEPTKNIVAFSGIRQSGAPTHVADEST